MLDLWGNEVHQETTIEEKVPKRSFFDCVNAIQYRKQITPDLINVYNPFMVNKTFQQNSSSVQIANIMNSLNVLPNDAQFNFYKLMFPNGVKSSKFTKKTVDKQLNTLLEFGYSIQDAQSILFVMTEEQVSSLIKELKKCLKKSKTK